MKNSLRKKILILVVTVVVAAGTYSFTDDYFEVSKNLDIFSTLYREVNLYYVDGTDPGKLMKKGIDEMLNSLDPYTNYIPEAEIEDYRFMTTGQYGGVGSLIKVKGDYVVITDPYEGYPVQKSGLMAGDVILEVDGKSVKKKTTGDVTRMLKGSPRSEVKVKVMRSDSSIVEKTLVREEIKVKNVPYSGMVNESIGYIKLTGFTENAGGEVKDALKELKANHQGLKGVILDLRGNPGGLLYEAVNISNVFVEKGQEIVSTKGKLKDMNKPYKSLNEPVDVNIPLAVLVNSNSASASEIVSGSLQDLDRGVIVGQRTFGKGLVQTTRMLSYNAQLKITTSKYYTPSGRCIQALDYAHRNADGSVGKIPDSLMSEFKTKAGRTVKDGGGVLPDVVTDKKVMSNIAQSLLTKDLVFDFATQYHAQHPSIASVDQFKLTEDDFTKFMSFIEGKDYDYSTKSEKSLDELKTNAEQEKYFQDISKEYETLKSKMMHNKKEDLIKSKTEIMNLLQDEIASRYFYLRGRTGSSLRHDVEVEKAIEVLQNNNQYASILNGSAKQN